MDFPSGYLRTENKIWPFLNHTQPWAQAFTGKTVQDRNGRGIPFFMRFQPRVTWASKTSHCSISITWQLRLQRHSRYSATGAPQSFQQTLRSWADQQSKLNYNKEECISGHVAAHCLSQVWTAYKIPPHGNLIFVLATGKGSDLVGWRPGAWELCCLMYEQPARKQPQTWL